MADQTADMASSMAALGQEFRGASDAKLRRVTQLIDRMTDRGAADALLQPVRDRLAALRPVRHMNRTRLLFTPFDRVLVPPARWQKGAFSLPRTILAPVIVLLDAATEPALPVVMPFDAADPAELLRCGRPLWAVAATVLARDGHRIAAETADQALPPMILADLLPVMTIVFRCAAGLRSLPPAGDPALEPAVLLMLNEAARSGPLGWGIMLVLLLEHAPADLVTRLVATIPRGERMAALLHPGLDHAVTDLLGRLEQAALPPRDAVTEKGTDTLLRRLEIKRRLDGLRAIPNRPGFEQKRMERLHAALEAGNRDLFRQTLETQAQELDEALSSHDPTDALLGLESDARRLRQFAVAAATLDGDRSFELMIETMTDRLVAVEVPQTQCVARLRMVELLAGTGRALQLAAGMRSGGMVA